MPTSDSTALCCSARGCVYPADPHTFGLFCQAHWEMVSVITRGMLRREHERYGSSLRFLELARIAVEQAADEEAQRALAEERGWRRPKAEARAV